MTENPRPRQERRREPRLLCADMIEVKVEDKPKHWRRFQANLEEISPSGARFEVDSPIRVGASVRLICPEFQVSGTVRHCTFRETGSFVGVEFHEGEKWSRARFWPKHLTDPRTAKARPVRGKSA